FKDGNIAEFIITIFNKAFLIAFQMAIPIVGCLFLVDVALGIIARAVPQLNVFVVGLPLKIFVSFVVILFFLSLYFVLAKSLFEDGIIAEFIITIFNKAFLIAFQMAIPIVGCLFLVDVALGIIARAVPQLNVFVVGLPLKIFVSFVVILFFLSLYIVLAKSLFETMFDTMQGLMKLFGGA